VDYTGIPDSEQLGYGWLEQVHPDDRERVREEWRAAVKSGSIFDVEHRIRSVQGTYHWFKTRSAPIRTADGTIVKWYGTSTDVDDLKRAEVLRRKSSDRLGDVVESVQQAFVLLDEDLVVTFFNAAAEELFSRNRHDVVGKKLLDVFPKLRGSALDVNFQRALADRKPNRFEANLVGDGLYRVDVTLLSEPDGIAVLLERRDHQGEVR
jgi:PAS domain S-box-containing protein